MNINDILKSIMTFVNENTILLIVICVFMILVLIGYLIDNSLKKKNVRKNDKIDIENDQLENKKVETETIEENKENSEEIANVVEPEKKIDNQEIEKPNVNEDIPNELDKELNLDDSQNISELDSLINLDLSNEQVNDNGLIDSNIENTDLLNIESNESNDPDFKIMNDNLYTNSKSLIEILSDVDKEKPKVSLDMPNSNINIFDNKPDIKINTDVEKNKVEIEPKYSSEDELDSIMKRLNSINNNDDEDNYTNIF